MCRSVTFIAVLLLICHGHAPAAPIDNVAKEPETGKTGQGSVADAIIDPLGSARPQQPVTELDAASAAAAEAFRQGRIDDCLAELRTIVAKKPSFPPPKLVLAGMYLSVDNRAEAKRLLEEVGREESTHPALYLSFADLALSEQRITDAWVHLRVAESVDTPSTWGEEEKTWLRSSIVSRQAIVAERRKNWDRAQALVAQLVQLHPDRPLLRHRWGSALFSAGRRQQAYEQFDIAHQQMPQLNRPEIVMAGLHVELGEYRDATKWYEKAQKADPTDPMLHLAWGMALLFQNRIDEAAKHVASAAELGENSFATDYQQGIVARVQSRYSDAESYFQHALELSPNHPEVTYHLVLTLLAQQDEALQRRALQLAQANTQLNENSSLAMAALAMALLKNGEKQKAEQAAQAAAAREDAHPEALFLYGKLLAASNQSDEAARIAARLERSLDLPMIFVAREAARKWVETVRADGERFRQPPR